MSETSMPDNLGCKMQSNASMSDGIKAIEKLTACLIFCWMVDCQRLPKNTGEENFNQFCNW